MSAAQQLAPNVLFGDRYTLVRPLATGGMAEIFLCRQKALAGFDKDVVVKRLQTRYRDDRRVVEMFLQEARIGAVLNHPHIVHVYDVGEHDAVPFIAMELIVGEELTDLCRRGLEVGNFLPLPHAVDLVRQAAEGMGYFHAKRGGGGDALAIVHRDISPSNLLVTQDGALKIIDFGIAQCSTPLRQDESILPGKYNYMAPEQIRGERVDHRSDIFSLGIVLYEITVGKRLFKGRPEEVIQKITRDRIKPPTFVHRDFPPALEAIVMRALELHADERYQSAYELAGDLEEYLHEAKLKSGPVRIATYLDDLKAAAGGERRPELVIAGEAWVNDEADDVLDFDRSFADVKKDLAAAPAVVLTIPVVPVVPEVPKAQEPDIVVTAARAPEAGEASEPKTQEVPQEPLPVAKAPVSTPVSTPAGGAPWSLVVVLAIAIVALAVLAWR
jgi:serine/threonine protein kinase